MKTTEQIERFCEENTNDKDLYQKLREFVYSQDDTDKEYVVTFYFSISKNVIASNKDDAREIAEEFLGQDIYEHCGIELDNVEVEEDEQ